MNIKIASYSGAVSILKLGCQEGTVAGDNYSTVNNEGAQVLIQTGYKSIGFYSEKHNFLVEYNGGRIFPWDRFPPGTHYGATKKLEAL